MFKPPTDSFEVQKPLNSWLVPELPRQSWQDDKDKKQLFGIELAKGLKPFEASLEVFPNETNKALWASHYWIADPVVIAARDAYREAVETKSNLLDKEALSVKLLQFAEEKHPSGNFYINEGKDRLTALKLYAEVQGFIGKSDTNLTNNFINNKLELVVVKAKKEEMVKTIDSEQDSEIENINPLPLNLKLVSAK